MLHRLVGFLVFIVLMGLGLLLFFSACSERQWALLADRIEFGRQEGRCAGAALVCMGALLALTGDRKKKRSRFLYFDSEKGRVSISTEAIAEYVGKLVSEFPSVMKLTPTVVPQKNAIDIVVSIEIKAGPQIHEACELLQDRIRESVTTGLGIPQVRRVEVSVGKILSEHKLT